MNVCKMKPIYGGPKNKYYCEVCKKLFDTPEPPECPNIENKK